MVSKHVIWEDGQVFYISSSQMITKRVLDEKNVYIKFTFTQLRKFNQIKLRVLNTMI